MCVRAAVPLWIWISARLFWVVDVWSGGEEREDDWTGKREARCDWPARHTNKEIAQVRELKVSRAVAG